MEHVTNLSHEEQQAVDHYRREYKDWKGAQGQNQSNGTSPIPFPKVPTRIDEDKNDTGNQLLGPDDVEPKFVLRPTEDGKYEDLLVVAHIERRGATQK